MNVLITGITGFVGSYLAEELLAQLGDSITLFGTSHSEKNLKNIESVRDRITLFSGDLRDKSFISKVVTESKPDWIFHLAALSVNNKSISVGQEIIINNLQIQLNLFEDILQKKIDSKILIIGSAQEYDLVSVGDSPIDERTQINPVSPYGFSKAAQDLAAYTYFKSFGLKVIRIRAFNHTGPRQLPYFVIPSFVKQIVDIEKTTTNNIIKVGNLDVVRDFTDVRDIVKAYVLAMTKCEIGDVYNLGLGKGYKISWLLDKIVEISQSDIKVEIDKSKLRPVDNPVTICNNNKFKTITQWEPLIPIEQTLQDILNYWRKNA